MNKKSLILTVIMCLSLLLAAVTFIVSCAEEPAPEPVKPTPEPVKPIELTLSWVATKDPLSDALFQQWVDDVERDTGGRVKITCYYAGQLVPPPETYDATIRGTQDIAASYFGVVPKPFPQTEVMQMVKIGTECPKLSSVAWELYKTTPEIQAEFSETKVLMITALGSAPPGLAMGFNKEVRTLEDLKGLKIHAAAKWSSRLVEALGAAPVQTMPQEIYSSLQKKVIDGGILDPVMLDAFGLGEVVHYWIDLPMQFNINYQVMNWDSWNSLPPDIQQVFEQNATRIPDRVDNYALEAGAAAMQVGIDKYGLTVIELAPEEKARWVEVHEGVRAEWVAEMEAQGFPGNKLLEHLDSLVAKYSVK
jgi:TRAP-type C4-dicarboxylate transport system substrate-binding protein